MTEETQLVATTEAILFSAGEPVETSRIAQTLGILEREVPSVMKMLQERYAATDSALQVLQLETAWQLATRPEYAPAVRIAMEKRRMQPLSYAAMEVLTIIAYNQPVSRGFVERVRGVDSSSIVVSLMEKGLLEEAGRVEVPGRPIAYRTTNLFLRVFGLHSLKELPELKQPDKLWDRKNREETFIGELAESSQQYPEQDVLS